MTADTCDLSNDTVVHIRTGDLEYIQFRHLLEYKDLVTHCFTTKRGGVSTGKHASMNLGLHNGDTRDYVLENYKRICTPLNMDPRQLVLSSQVHDNLIWRVTEEDAGKGIFRESDIKGYDGLITDRPGIPMVTFHADCLPVFLFDPITGSAGLVHSGWRGTVKKIIEKAITSMKKNFSAKAENILAGIGPSIGLCCFEVDYPVVQEFVNAFTNYEFDKFIVKKDNNKWHIDLKAFAAGTLMEAGVTGEHIYDSKICTKCNENIFFSHRAHGSERGTLGALMQLTRRM